jgi:hypothetical protein
MRHSYTKISMYMSCPMKKKGRYELGIKEERGPAASRGVDVHAAFEHSVLTGDPLPVEFAFYEDYIKRLRSCSAKPELKIGVDREWKPTEYDSPDSWLIGIVDLVADQGDTVYGWDWKTGKIYDDHVKQKEFYTCMLADAYPAANKFVFSNIYVDSKQEKTHTFTRTDVDHLRGRWGNRIAVMERDTDCAPTPSFGCRYCPVSKARGGPCPF